MSSAPMRVPRPMAISAHQKVSPIETVTAPRTTLKTLTLPPNQNANWCHGLPCRAPAGMWSMCRFSTYRRSCSRRAADTAISVYPFFVETCWCCRGCCSCWRTGLPAADQVGGFLGDGQHGGVQGGVGDDGDHRGVGDPQPGDPADPQLGVYDRAGVGTSA